jgi:hypothetical protein
VCKCTCTVQTSSPNRQTPKILYISLGISRSLFPRRSIIRRAGVCALASASEQICSYSMPPNTISVLSCIARFSARTVRNHLRNCRWPSGVGICVTALTIAVGRITIPVHEVENKFNMTVSEHDLFGQTLEVVAHTSHTYIHTYGIFRTLFSKLN